MTKANKKKKMNVWQWRPITVLHMTTRRRTLTSVKYRRQVVSGHNNSGSQRLYSSFPLLAIAACSIATRFQKKTPRQRVVYFVAPILHYVHLSHVLKRVALKHLVCFLLKCVIYSVTLFSR